MADLETRDALEADMAEHQRRHARDVTAGQNESLAAEALRLLDKQREEAKPAPAPEPQPTVTRRELNGHTYTLEREPDKTPMYRTASEFEAQVLKHAKPRVELLLSKPDEGPLGSPSWRQRALAAFYFKIKSLEAGHSGKKDEADVYERAFQQDLYELLEASNQVFGDWRKDAPAAPLIVQVTQ